MRGGFRRKLELEGTSQVRRGGRSKSRTQPDGLDLSHHCADVDVRLGSLIRSLRSAHKLSQTELGDRIGVSFQQVQKYERGANRVSASTLVLIANAFGVSASEILQMCEAPADASGRSALPADSLEHELLEGFRSIASSDRRRTIVNLVSEIAKA